MLEQAKTNAVIIDFDGTLCDCQHRLHFIDNPSGKKDWHAFHVHLVEDKINPWCQEIAVAMARLHYEIIFLSGRPETYRGLTQQWLEKYFADEFHYQLFLRRKNDYRADFVMKEAIYLEYIQPYYKILFVIDDKPAVVEMWRRNQLVCLQC